MGTVGVGSSVWELLYRGAEYGNSWSREQCMGTVGTRSSVVETNGTGSNKWEQWEQGSVYGNSWNMEQCTVYILSFIHRLVSNFPNVFVPIDMETKVFSLVDFEFVCLHPYLQHKNTGQTYSPFHTKKYMYSINILTK